MTNRRIGLPDDLRARWPHTPRLAWVISRAFGVAQGPGPGGDVWAVPAAVLLDLPVVLAATLTGRAATNKDRSAVLIVYPDRRSSAGLYLIAAVWFAAMIAITYVASDLSLSWVTTRTQLHAAVAAWIVIGIAILAPAFANAAILVRRGLQRDALGTFRHAARLRREGKPTAVISAWAAWPAHHGAGRRLADDILPHVPPQIWLVATADDQTVERWLHHRGFRRTGRGLLMERAGIPPLDS
jgi:hypothetical protein